MWDRPKTTPKTGLLILRSLGLLLFCFGLLRCLCYLRFSGLRVDG